MEYTKQQLEALISLRLLVEASYYRVTPNYLFGWKQSKSGKIAPTAVSHADVAGEWAQLVDPPAGSPQAALGLIPQGYEGPADLQPFVGSVKVLEDTPDFLAKTMTFMLSYMKKSVPSKTKRDQYLVNVVGSQGTKGIALVKQAIGLSPKLKKLVQDIYGSDWEGSYNALKASGMKPKNIVPVGTLAGASKAPTSAPSTPTQAAENAVQNAQAAATAIQSAASASKSMLQGWLQQYAEATSFLPYKPLQKLVDLGSKVSQMHFTGLAEKHGTSPAFQKTYTTLTGQAYTPQGAKTLYYTALGLSIVSLGVDAAQPKPTAKQVSAATLVGTEKHLGKSADLKKALHLPSVVYNWAFWTVWEMQNASSLEVRKLHFMKFFNKYANTLLVALGAPSDITPEIALSAQEQANAELVNASTYKPLTKENLGDADLSALGDAAYWLTEAGFASIKWTQIKAYLNWDEEPKIKDPLYKLLKKQSGSPIFQEYEDFISANPYPWDEQQQAVITAYADAVDEVAYKMYYLNLAMALVEAASPQSLADIPDEDIASTAEALGLAKSWGISSLQAQMLVSAMKDPALVPALMNVADKIAEALGGTTYGDMSVDAELSGAELDALLDELGLGDLLAEPGSLSTETLAALDKIESTPLTTYTQKLSLTLSPGTIAHYAGLLPPSKTLSIGLESVLSLAGSLTDVGFAQLADIVKHGGSPAVNDLSQAYGLLTDAKNAPYPAQLRAAHTLFYGAVLLAAVRVLIEFAKLPDAAEDLTPEQREELGAALDSINFPVQLGASTTAVVALVDGIRKDPTKFSLVVPFVQVPLAPFTAASTQLMTKLAADFYTVAQFIETLPEGPEKASALATLAEGSIGQTYEALTPVSTLDQASITEAVAVGAQFLKPMLGNPATFDLYMLLGLLTPPSPLASLTIPKSQVDGVTAFMDSLPADPAIKDALNLYPPTILAKKSAQTLLFYCALKSMLVYDPVDPTKLDTNATIFAIEQAELPFILGVSLTTLLHYLPWVSDPLSAESLTNTQTYFWKQFVTYAVKDANPSLSQYGSLASTTKDPVDIGEGEHVFLSMDAPVKAYYQVANDTGIQFHKAAQNIASYLGTNMTGASFSTNIAKEQESATESTFLSLCYPAVAKDFAQSFASALFKKSLILSAVQKMDAEGQLYQVQMQPEDLVSPTASKAWKARVLRAYATTIRVFQVLWTALSPQSSVGTQAKITLHLASIYFGKADKVHGISARFTKVPKALWPTLALHVFHLAAAKDDGGKALAFFHGMEALLAGLELNKDEIFQGEPLPVKEQTLTDAIATSAALSQLSKPQLHATALLALSPMVKLGVESAGTHPNLGDFSNLFATVNYDFSALFAEHWKAISAMLQKLPKLPVLNALAGPGATATKQADTDILNGAFYVVALIKGFLASLFAMDPSKMPASTAALLPKLKSMLADPSEAKGNLSELKSLLQAVFAKVDKQVLMSALNLSDLDQSYWDMTVSYFAEYVTGSLGATVSAPNGPALSDTANQLAALLTSSVVSEFAYGNAQPVAMQGLLPGPAVGLNDTVQSALSPVYGNALQSTHANIKAALGHSLGVLGLDSEAVMSLSSDPVDSGTPAQQLPPAVPPANEIDAVTDIVLESGATGSLGNPALFESLGFLPPSVKNTFKKIVADYGSPANVPFDKQVEYTQAAVATKGSFMSWSTLSAQCKYALLLAKVRKLMDVSAPLSSFKFVSSVGTNAVDLSQKNPLQLQMKDWIGAASVSATGLNGDLLKSVDTNPMFWAEEGLPPSANTIAVLMYHASALKNANAEQAQLVWTSITKQLADLPSVTSEPVTAPLAAILREDPFSDNGAYFEQFLATTGYLPLTPGTAASKLSDLTEKLAQDLFNGYWQYSVETAKAVSKALITGDAKKATSILEPILKKEWATLLSTLPSGLVTPEAGDAIDTKLVEAEARSVVMFYGLSRAVSHYLIDIDKKGFAIEDALKDSKGFFKGLLGFSRKFLAPIISAEKLALKSGQLEALTSAYVATLTVYNKTGSTSGAENKRLRRRISAIFYTNATGVDTLAWLPNAASAPLKPDGTVGAPISFDMQAWKLLPHWMASTCVLVESKLTGLTVPNLASLELQGSKATAGNPFVDSLVQYLPSTLQAAASQDQLIAKKASDYLVASGGPLANVGTLRVLWLGVAVWIVARATQKLLATQLAYAHKHGILLGATLGADEDFITQGPEAALINALGSGLAANPLFADTSVSFVKQWLVGATQLIASGSSGFSTPLLPIILIVLRRVASAQKSAKLLINTSTLESGVLDPIQIDLTVKLQEEGYYADKTLPPVLHKVYAFLAEKAQAEYGWENTDKLPTLDVTSEHAVHHIKVQDPYPTLALNPSSFVESMKTELSALLGPNAVLKTKAAFIYQEMCNWFVQGGGSISDPAQYAAFSKAMTNSFSAYFDIPWGTHLAPIFNAAKQAFSASFQNASQAAVANAYQIYETEVFNLLQKVLVEAPQNEPSLQNLFASPVLPNWSNPHAALADNGSVHLQSDSVALPGQSASSTVIGDDKQAVTVNVVEAPQAPALTQQAVRSLLRANMFSYVKHNIVVGGEYGHLYGSIALLLLRHGGLNVNTGAFLAPTSAQEGTELLGIASLYANKLKAKLGMSSATSKWWLIGSLGTLFAADVMATMRVTALLQQHSATAAKTFQTKRVQLLAVKHSVPTKSIQALLKKWSPTFAVLHLQISGYSSTPMQKYAIDCQKRFQKSVAQSGKLLGVPFVPAPNMDSVVSTVNTILKSTVSTAESSLSPEKAKSYLTFDTTDWNLHVQAIQGQMYDELKVTYAPGGDFSLDSDMAKLAVDTLLVAPSAEEGQVGSATVGSAPSPQSATAAAQPEKKKKPKKDPTVGWSGEAPADGSGLAVTVSVAEALVNILAQPSVAHILATTPLAPQITPSAPSVYASPNAPDLWFASLPITDENYSASLGKAAVTQALGGEFGTKAKYVLTENTGGEKFLVKPLTPNEPPFRAVAAVAASQVASLLFEEDFVVPVATITPQMAGVVSDPVAGGEVFIQRGTIQPIKKNATPFVENVSGAFYPPNAVPGLSTGQLNDIVRETLLDYLTFNKDGKAANLIRTADNRLVGIDKEQAFKDVFSSHNTPTVTNALSNTHYNPTPPVYKSLVRACQLGADQAKQIHSKLDLKSLGAYLDRLEAISNEDYLAAVQPYISQMAQTSTPHEVMAFRSQVLYHKDTARQVLTQLLNDMFATSYSSALPIVIPKNDGGNAVLNPADTVDGSNPYVTQSRTLKAHPGLVTTLQDYIPALADLQPATGYPSALKTGGGAQFNDVYRTAEGDLWFTKRAREKSGGGAKPFVADISEAFSAVAILARGEHVPVVNIGKTGKGAGSAYTTMQPVLKLDKDKPTLSSYAPAKLTTQEVNDVAAEHVLDWLFCQHDSHGANLVRTIEGRIFGVDKEQAFRFIGDPKERLGLGYAPNPAASYYDSFWTSFMAKELDDKLDFGQMANVISRIEAIPGPYWEGILTKYAASFFPDAKSQEVFLQHGVARKVGIRQEFESFITSLYIQREKTHGIFTFDKGFIASEPAPSDSPPTAQVPGETPLKGRKGYSIVGSLSALQGLISTTVGYKEVAGPLYTVGKQYYAATAPNTDKVGVLAVFSFMLPYTFWETYVNKYGEEVAATKLSLLYSLEAALLTKINSSFEAQMANTIYAPAQLSPTQLKAQFSSVLVDTLAADTEQFLAKINGEDLATLALITKGPADYPHVMTDADEVPIFGFMVCFAYTTEKGLLKQFNPGSAGEFVSTTTLPKVGAAQDSAKKQGATALSTQLSLIQQVYATGPDEDATAIYLPVSKPLPPMDELAYTNTALNGLSQLTPATRFSVEAKTFISDGALLAGQTMRAMRYKDPSNDSVFFIVSFRLSREGLMKSSLIRKIMEIAATEVDYAPAKSKYPKGNALVSPLYLSDEARETGKFDSSEGCIILGKSVFPGYRAWHWKWEDEQDPSNVGRLYLAGRGNSAQVDPPKTDAASFATPKIPVKNGLPDLMSSAGEAWLSNLGYVALRIKADYGANALSVANRMLSQLMGSSSELLAQPSAASVRQAKLAALYEAYVGRAAYLSLSPAELTADSLEAALSTLPAKQGKTLTQRMQRTERVEVMPGYTAYVERGRWREYVRHPQSVEKQGVATTPGVLFVVWVFSQPETISLILGSGAKSTQARVETGAGGFNDIPAPSLGFSVGTTSAAADQAYGGGEGITVCVMGTSDRSRLPTGEGSAGAHRDFSVILSPAILDRLDVLYHSKDKYGAVYGSSVAGDEGLLKELKRTADVNTPTGGELVVPWGIDKRYVLGVNANKGPKSRESLITYLLQQGITSIAGIPTPKAVWAEPNCESIFLNYVAPSLGMGLRGVKKKK